MGYMNRMWAAAAGVVMVNSHSDQGQKLKSITYGKRRFFTASGGADVADLRPLSSLIVRGDGLREQTEESLRQVMYINCWGQG